MSLRPQNQGHGPDQTADCPPEARTCFVATRGTSEACSPPRAFSCCSRLRVDAQRAYRRGEDSGGRTLDTGSSRERLLGARGETRHGRSPRRPSASTGPATPSNPHLTVPVPNQSHRQSGPAPGGGAATDCHSSREPPSGSDSFNQASLRRLLNNHLVKQKEVMVIRNSKRHPICVLP